MRRFVLTIILEMQDYLFDLRGYLILENAVDAAHVTELNSVLDSFPPLEWGQWYGSVQRFDNNGAAGQSCKT